MDRDEAWFRLERHRGGVPQLGIRSLALFGSTARGEARTDSDVDLVGDFQRPIGLLALVRFQRRMEEWMDAPVDLIPSDSAKPALREVILREAAVGPQGTGDAKPSEPGRKGHPRARLNDTYSRCR